MSRPRIALVTALTAVDSRLPSRATEREPPVGVLTLASLVRHEYPTEVVDLDNIWTLADGDAERFIGSSIRAICEKDPQIVGFSSICGSYPTTLRLADLVARELPTAYLVLGGPQASVVDVPTLKAFPYIDAVVRGEADHTFPALLEAFPDNEQIRSVGGITFRMNGEVSRNSNAPVVLEMDAVPLPSFDLFNGIENLRTLPLEVGRGCPFACKFCSTNDFFRRRFRLKTTACIIRQMHELSTRYGRIVAFDFVHDMFTVDRGKVVELCRGLIDVGAKFKWCCSARTDCVDAELLELMKQAGCASIFFGIETGSQRLQREIDKGLNLLEARAILVTSNRLEMRTTAALIMGYPQETVEDFHATVGFFADTNPLQYVEHQFHVLSPLADTPLTTSYKDQLYLDERWVENSENGLEQDVLDRSLIAAHPEIFPNFYAFPCALDRSYLRRAGNFLMYGSLRCNGLLTALKLAVGSLVQVIQKWDEIGQNRPPGHYLSWDFVQDVTALAEREYGYLKDAGITATVRFYRELAKSGSKQRPHVSASDPATVFLDPNIHLIEVEGDIIRVLETLRAGVKPDSSLLERTVAVVVRQEIGKSCTISEVPSLSLTILRHVERQSTLEDMVRDVERQNIRIGALQPRTIVRHGLDYLRRQGFVQPAIAGVRAESAALR
jgi:radical SAM superfamily enzyme YgiQ (UPF0313 family)